MVRVRSIFHSALFVLFLVLVVAATIEAVVRRVWKWAGSRSLFKISPCPLSPGGGRATRMGHRVCRMGR